MTNEEAKEKIFYQWQDFLEHNIDYAGISEAYKMAIKALEQYGALQEIRQEIEQIEVSGYKDAYTCFIRTGDQVKNMAIKLIDNKIKKVSE